MVHTSSQTSLKATVKTSWSLLPIPEASFLNFFKISQEASLENQFLGLPHLSGNDFFYAVHPLLLLLMQPEFISFCLGL